MFFQTIEFYVISAVVAAAVIALMARPPHSGPAITRLLAPFIGPDVDTSAPPRLLITCDDHANLTITRTGLTGNISDLKIAVTVKGHDISIEESPISGPDGAYGSLSATFTIDFIGRDHYHMSYTAAHQSLFAAASFTVTPGLRIDKPLTLS